MLRPSPDRSLNSPGGHLNRDSGWFTSPLFLMMERVASRLHAPEAAEPHSLEAQEGSFDQKPTSYREHHRTHAREDEIGPVAPLLDTVERQELLDQERIDIKPVGKVAVAVNVVEGQSHGTEDAQVRPHHFSDLVILPDLQADDEDHECERTKPIRNDDLVPIEVEDHSQREDEGQPHHVRVAQQEHALQEGRIEVLVDLQCPQTTGKDKNSWAPVTKDADHPENHDAEIALEFVDQCPQRTIERMRPRIASKKTIDAVLVHREKGVVLDITQWVIAVTHHVLVQRPMLVDEGQRSEHNNSH